VRKHQLGMCDKGQHSLLLSRRPQRSSRQAHKHQMSSNSPVPHVITIDHTIGGVVQSAAAAAPWLQCQADHAQLLRANCGHVTPPGRGGGQLG
jgi:hypothetical protein